MRDILRAIHGDGLRELRDRAILGFGMASALRRSELVALTVADLAHVPGGLRVHVARSKTDQEGQGERVPVPAGRRIRPIALLDAWFTAAGIAEGPLFRRFTRHGHVGDAALSDRAVALIVQARAAAAGYDPQAFAEHSLRARFLTAAAAKATVWKMQRVSRHQSIDVLAGYVRDADDFRDHAGDEFL